MSQTTISAGGRAIGVAGQIADSGPHDIVSGVNKEVSAQVPFGFALRQQPGVEQGYLLPTGISNLGLPIEGLSVFGHNHAKAGVPDPAGAYAGDLGGSGLLPNAGLQVARSGRFLLPVEVAVRPGDRGYARVWPTGVFTAGIWAGTNYGASYHVDCSRQVEFRSSTYTAADGTTLVAVAEVDFVNRTT